MNRKSYIQIIIDTFWETRAPILSEIAEPMLDFRKTLFLTELKRKQKIAKRDFFVTLKDFEMQCCLAIDELNTTIGNTAFGYIQAWGDKNLYLNADYNWQRNGHGYKISEFTEILKLEVEWEDRNDLYVALNSLYPYLNGSVCGWDIEFIEWVLENINLSEEEKPAAEPLYLSDTSAVKTLINNDHREIFSNNGFMFFEHILCEYIKPKNKTGRYEDLSYHYRCMFDDKFIHQKPETFRLWFINVYTEEFSKIKTKTQVTNPQRKKDYSTALDWLKSKNK